MNPTTKNICARRFLIGNIDLCFKLDKQAKYEPKLFSIELIKRVHCGRPVYNLDVILGKLWFSASIERV
jgi:hypothetical protein